MRTDANCFIWVIRDIGRLLASLLRFCEKSVIYNYIENKRNFLENNLHPHVCPLKKSSVQAIFNFITFCTILNIR